MSKRVVRWSAPSLLSSVCGPVVGSRNRKEIVSLWTRKAKEDERVESECERTLETFSRMPPTSLRAAPPLSSVGAQEAACFPQFVVRVSYRGLPTRRDAWIDRNPSVRAI